MGRDKYTKISRGVKVREYESGRRIYHIAFTYKGVECRETLKVPVTRGNDQYAIRLKAEIENAIGRQTFKYTDYFPDSPRARLFGHAVSTVTVRELLENWLKDIERSHPHSTYRAYRKSCHSTLIPTLGGFRAIDLAQNPEPIKNMIRSRDVTLKTIRNDLTPLRAVFDQALTESRIDRNPLDKIKVKDLIDRKNQSNYRIDPYSLEEITLLLKEADDHRPEWRPYWQIAFFSGVRTSEQYGLKWSDVDWRDQSVQIQRAVVERMEKEAKTKTSERTIELLPMAYQALRDQRQHTEAWSEYIFCNPRTKAQIRDYEETTAVLKYLCKRAGIRYRNQYQTRHSYASNLLSGGENIYFVANQLGHRNIGMVISTYVKWIKQGRKKQQRQYVSEFANLTKESHDYRTESSALRLGYCFERVFLKSRGGSSPLLGTRPVTSPHLSTPCCKRKFSFELK